MRILIVGGGGREHALAWRLIQSPSVTELFASPGNPGIAQVARCLPAPPDVLGYAALAEQYQIDLTIVGPEAPLVAGIVDCFRARNLAILGPTAAAARLEGSKLFAKQFFARAGIPTARSSANINDFSFPTVIKADGLAAGKGVVIAGNRREADEAIQRLGPNLVIEEFLEGEEVSFIGLSNGREIVPFPATQDHKRLLAGDLGPNTGGMGAYLDKRLLTPQQISLVMDRVMMPAIAQMNKEGTPFTGFLYAGLMLTASGPKVLEFNVRLGDPETQVLMHTFKGDVAELFRCAAHGGPLTISPSSEEASVCVVLAAHGYPEQVRTGDPISGIADAEALGATVFHAGTKLASGQTVTGGGRVLGVTASAPDLPDAVSRAYKAVEQIRFAGMQYRPDIASGGLNRWYTAK